MSASERLVKWLEVLREPDAEMSKIAADKLGEIGSVEAVKDLIDALERRTAFVAAAAAQALGRIGDKRAVPSLVHALLEHHDVMVQTAAAEALGLIKSPDGIPALKQTIIDYLDTFRSDHYSLTRGFKRGLYTTSILALKRIGTKDALRFVQKAESQAQ